MTDVSQPLFLFGPGYSARALAAIWDGPVVAAARSEQARKGLNEAGIEALSAGAIGAGVQGAHILVSAPPGEAGCPGLAALVDFAAQAASVTYLSTTGVYGDLNGGWAFEWSQPMPGSARARRRLAAETAWRQVRPDAAIVRLPGIYGPGRSALDRLRTGQARRVVKPEHVFSRVHVADLASGLKALIASGASGVFHLCDEQAAPPQDVTAFAASLLGLQPPPEFDFAAADLSPMARSFYAECKRVSNARVKAATGWRPQYPTYREGLTAIHAGGA